MIVDTFFENDESDNDESSNQSDVNRITSEDNTNNELSQHDSQGVENMLLMMKSSTTPHTTILTHTPKYKTCLKMIFLLYHVVIPLMPLQERGFPN